MALVPMESFVDTSLKTIITNGTILLTSSNNLNNVTDFGFYSWSSGSVPTNSPTQGSGTLLNLKYAAAGIMQIIFIAGSQSGLIYWRVYSGGTWYGWRYVNSSGA